MQNKYLYFLRLALFVSDCIALNLAFFTASNIADIQRTNSFNDWKYSYFVIILIWVMTSTVFKLYQLNPINNFKGVVWATVQSTLMQIFIFLAYANFVGTEHIWNFLLIFITVLFSAFIVSRYLFIITEPFVNKFFGPKKTISLFELYSSNRQLAPYLNSYAMHHQFEAVTIDGHKDWENENEASAYRHFFKESAEKGLSEVYVSLPTVNAEITAQLQKEADRYGIRLKLIYNYNRFIQSPFLTNIGNIPVLSLRKEPLEDINNIVVKRLFDIVFSLLVIVFILSWLFPIIALLIICESKGDVFFKQMRNGLNGKQFQCYKFRSMRINSFGDVLQARENDSRITTIGKFLRKTSIDELPQFWNVLIGNMSIVGPRPHMLKHTEEYRALINNYMVRHYLKPGITGWAQVNGFRGETQTLDLMEQRVEHDIWYIENWSTKLDVQIIYKTCFNIFKGESKAY